jgi:hypothetical protein
VGHGRACGLFASRRSHACRLFGRCRVRRGGIGDRSSPAGRCGWIPAILRQIRQGVAGGAQCRWARRNRWV